VTRRAVSVLIAAVIILAGLTISLVWWAPTGDRSLLPFPPDKTCAIAVTDDTDFFQFESVGPVYALMDSLGIRVTKTVWAYDHPDHPPSRAGLSLEDPEYLAWVLEEASRGHDIVLHSATAGHDEREVTVEAHRYLADLLGERPSMVIFHSTNREAFYWGSHRVPTKPLRFLYRRRTGAIPFEGEDASTPYFWVDVSRWLVRYVRGYTTEELNTLAVNPSMPYSDPWAPASPLWCASSNGRVAEDFVSILSAGNVEELKAERGASIVYTHFASGFAESGPGGEQRVTPDARETLTRCGRDPAVEFVPAGELLDRLRLLQFVEEAIVGSEDTPGPAVVAVPSEIAYAVDDVSVVPSRLPAPLNVPEVPAGRSVAMRVWLEAVGWEIAPNDAGFFDYARTLPLRERWRLVLRWIAASLSNSSSDYGGESE
jgi:hypothetical protein